MLLLDRRLVAAAKQELCERSLYEYVKQAWHLVEPDQPFVDNWHVRKICDALENIVRNKEAPDLLINIPPGCMKSLLTSVFLPTWTWGPLNWAGCRFMFASYSQDLSSRDSMKCRSIFKSEWFQSRWGTRFKMTRDNDEKSYFSNDHRGWRLATSVGGRGTGEHPDVIVIDDPHNVKQSESDQLRNAAREWFTGTISTRGATRKVRKICVMQRLHKMDLAALILEQGGWDHICLPMRFEPGVMGVTSLGWTDPRTVEGELLWPKLWTADVLAKVEAAMGPLKTAGQLQQRPGDKDGNIFKREHFKPLGPAWPAYEDGDQVVLYWDKASVEDGGDWTAGVLMMIKAGGQIIVIDVTRGQWGIAIRNQTIEMKSRLAAGRYKQLRVVVEQEPGSGGKESAEHTIRQLRGLRVSADKKGGSKMDCWEPYASQVLAGNVSLVEGDWCQDFLSEHADAPIGAHDDQIDAAAGAFNAITGKPVVDIKAWLKAGAM